MPAVPVLRPREVIGILETLGFAETRYRGSQWRCQHRSAGVYGPGGLLACTE